MMNSRGACNRKKDVLFPTASLKETEQEGVFYSNLVFILFFHVIIFQN